MVRIHINNNIRHHSGQNLLQTHKEQWQISGVDKSTDHTNDHCWFVN